MIKILAMLPNKDDACSWYRGAGVLNYLEGVSVDYVGQTVSWADLAKYDVLFMQRPFTVEHTQIFHLAKTMKIKVWCDWDDDLLNVPASNPNSRIYNTEDGRNRIKHCIANADLVTVSTEALGLSYAPYTRDTGHLAVVHNAFNDYVNDIAYENNSESVTVTWRGLSSHKADLEHYRPALYELHREHADLEFKYLGEPINAIRNDAGKLNNVEILPTSPLPFYFNNFSRLKPRVHLVLLTDTPFNRSKSNIAYIEASAAGAVVVAPDFGEFSATESVLYTPGDLPSLKDSFKRALHIHLLGAFNRLSVQNAKRLRLLKSLVLK